MTRSQKQLDRQNEEITCNLCGAYALRKHMARHKKSKDCEMRKNFFNIDKNIFTYPSVNS